MAYVEPCLWFDHFPLKTTKNLIKLFPKLYFAFPYIFYSSYTFVHKNIFEKKSSTTQIKITRY